MLLRSAEVPYAQIPPLGSTLSRLSVVHSIVPRTKRCNVIQPFVIRVFMSYIPLRFATLNPTRVSNFPYSCCLTYLLKFNFNYSFHIRALRNIYTYVTNKQMDDKICSIIFDIQRTVHRNIFL